MLRRLLFAHPLLVGVLLAIGMAWLFGRLMLAHHAGYVEESRALEARIVLPAEIAPVQADAPALSPVRVTGRVRAERALSGELGFLAAQGDVAPEPIVVRTEEDGSFSVTLTRPGEHLVTFAPDGVGLPRAIELNLNVPPTDELSIGLEMPRGRVKGLVFESDGAFARDASVELRRTSEEGAEEEAWASMLTDESGEFTFRCLPAGIYALRVELEGRVKNRRIELLHEPLEEVTISLPPTEPHSAAVTDG